MPVSNPEDRKRLRKVDIEEEQEEEEVAESEEEETSHNESRDDEEGEEEEDEGSEAGDEEEVEFEFTCDGCSEGLYPEDTRFHCEECGDFDLCENCFFDEEGEKSTHEHTLVEVKEGKVFFIHKDQQTGNSLILSDFRAVLPPSNPIKKHNVKSVLSAVDFHVTGNCNKELDKLQAIYNLTGAKSIPASSTICHDGVVYHHMNMPDLQKPSLLKDHGVAHALEEACAFIDCAMARGNTLVHCERGQFRSPTLILAWLITKGMKAEAAIDHIANDYEGWGKKYTRSRPEWVERLRKWETDNKKERQSWGTAHHTHVQLWKAKYPSVAKKADVEKSESIESKASKSEITEPLKKKVKV